MFSQLNSRKELEIPFYIFYLQINLRLQIHVFRVVSFFKTKTLTLRKMHLGAVEMLDFFSHGPYLPADIGVEAGNVASKKLLVVWSSISVPA